MRRASPYLKETVSKCRQGRLRLDGLAAAVDILRGGLDALLDIGARRMGGVAKLVLELFGKSLAGKEASGRTGRPKGDGWPRWPFGCRYLASQTARLATAHGTD